MIGSSVLAMVLTHAGFTIPQLFLVTGILNAVVAIYIYTLVPEFLIRFVMWLLLHTVYRVRVEGADQIPDEGPCLLRVGEGVVQEPGQRATDPLRRLCHRRRSRA